MKKLQFGLALVVLLTAGGITTHAAEGRVIRGGVAPTAPAARIDRNTYNDLPQAQLLPDSPVESGDGFTPFMLSLIWPVQVPPGSWDVGGLRINLLYGECQNFAGLDISGLAGRSRGNADGLLIAGIANIVDGDSTSLAIAPVNYVAGSTIGLQIGIANIASMHSGAAAAAWQIGVVNYANAIRGCQIGLINYARNMIGVQIGLINVIENSDYSVLPIVNVYF